MAVTRSTRPGVSPARAKAVRQCGPGSAAKPRATKPRATRRSPKAEDAATAPPDAATPEPAAATAAEGAVAARRATMARTLVRGDLGRVKVDPDDDAAREKLAALASGWERAVAAAEDADADADPSARRKRSAAERVDDPEPAAGPVLIDRLTRSIERELCAIERIVGVRPKRGQRTETERRARTLASLARTLAELRRLRGDADSKRPLDDDAVPRDLDELRRALSRRLEQMVGGAAELPAAGDE